MVWLELSHSEVSPVDRKGLVRAHARIHTYTHRLQLLTDQRGRWQRIHMAGDDV